MARPKSTPAATPDTEVTKVAETEVVKASPTQEDATPTAEPTNAPAAQEAEPAALAASDDLYGDMHFTLEQFLMGRGHTPATAAFAGGVLIRAVGAFPRTAREWQEAYDKFLGDK